MNFIFRYLAALIASYYQRAFVFALKPQTFPTLQDMAANLAVDLGSIEIVKWELYDYLLYPTAGILNLGFFLNGLGQGLSATPGNAGLTKVITDTNLSGSGVLPSPQAFWCELIEVMVDPGSSSAANTFAIQNPTGFATASAAAVQAGEIDVNQILTSGSLQFTVSSKPYYQTAPLHRAPPVCRPQLDVAVQTTSGTAGEIIKAKAYASGEPLKLDPGVGIMTAQNFNVQMVWPVIVATSSGNNARVGTVLKGWLFRGVQ